jgi:hypothetical protein
MVTATEFGIQEINYEVIGFFDDFFFWLQGALKRRPIAACDLHHKLNIKVINTESYSTPISQFHDILNV